MFSAKSFRSHKSTILSLVGVLILLVLGTASVCAQTVVGRHLGTVKELLW